MTNMTYAMRTSVSEMKLLSMKDYMTRNIHCQGYHIQALCAFNKTTPIVKQISDSNFYLKNTPTSLNFTPTSAFYIKLMQGGRSCAEAFAEKFGTGRKF